MYKLRALNIQAVFDELDEDGTVLREVTSDVTRVFPKQFDRIVSDAQAAEEHLNTKKD